MAREWEKAIGKTILFLVMFLCSFQPQKFVGIAVWQPQPQAQKRLYLVQGGLKAVGVKVKVFSLVSLDR